MSVLSLPSMRLHKIGDARLGLAAFGKRGDAAAAMRASAALGPGCLCPSSVFGVPMRYRIARYVRQ